jgi:hypothetical protein
MSIPYGWPRNTPADIPDSFCSLLGEYQNIRLDLESLEELAAQPDPEFSEDELKKLDKAIVVMRTGSKLIKRILRKRGFHGNLKTHPATESIGA